MTQENRVRVIAAAILGVVFAAGVTVGIAFDQGVADAAPESTEMAQPEPEGQPPRGPNRWIIDRLDLTQDQRSQVDSVVEHFGAQMVEFHRQYRGQFRTVIDSTNQAIFEILDEEQQIEYDSLQAEAERWRERRSQQDRSEGDRR